MEQDNLTFKELSRKDIDAVVALAQKLNPNKTKEELSSLMPGMFDFPTYHCFGLYQQGKLIGITSGWITIRFYCGKQLEIDNVVIDSDIRSAGLGAKFLAMIEQWAKERDCKTIELNTYTQNTRSHKFYHNQGYVILGFHFQKVI